MLRLADEILRCRRHARECAELCARVPQALRPALVEVADGWLDLAAEYEDAGQGRGGQPRGGQ